MCYLFVFENAFFNVDGFKELVLQNYFVQWPLKHETDRDLAAFS